ncbi:MAG: class III extradiol ring-cleavage dioxygenase [Archangium sp.]
MSAFTRRQTIAAAAAVTAASCTRSETKAPTPTMSTARQPVIFLPHGGGPWPFVELGFGTKKDNDALRAYLESVPSAAKTPPKAVLVISAHWEEDVPTVMTSPQPPMLYDYYGFPPESYEITWPAPGAPELAKRVRGLLEGAGFQTAEDPKRGFDHGTFVPLKLAWPTPTLPTLQLSLKTGLDPKEHLAMGRALAPLRDEGVFIIGSGMTFHNLRAFMNPAAGPVSVAFDGWLRETMQKPQAERDAGLEKWASAPAARQSHPREEHLIPAMVCAGAALGDVATIPYANTYAGVVLSAYQFG